MSKFIKILHGTSIALNIIAAIAVVVIGILLVHGVTFHCQGIEI